MNTDKWQTNEIDNKISLEKKKGYKQQSCKVLIGSQFIKTFDT